MSRGRVFRSRALRLGGGALVALSVVAGLTYWHTLLSTRTRIRMGLAGSALGLALVPLLGALPPSGLTLAATLGQLRHLMGAADGAPVAAGTPLKMISAGVGNQIRLVPIDEVVCFEASDKYVRVLTTDHEYLIRTPLKELLPQLDAHAFWQVHRGTVVRADAIDTVMRDEAGKLHLTLRGRADRFAVSRLYAHLFKAM